MAGTKPKPSARILPAAGPKGRSGSWALAAEKRSVSARTVATSRWRVTTHMSNSSLWNAGPSALAAAKVG